MTEEFWLTWKKNAIIFYNTYTDWCYCYHTTKFCTENHILYECIDSVTSPIRCQILFLFLLFTTLRSFLFLCNKINVIRAQLKEINKNCMWLVICLSLFTLAFPLVLPPLSLSTASFHSASSCLICSSTWFEHNRPMSAVLSTRDGENELLKLQYWCPGSFLVEYVCFKMFCIL